MVDEHLGDLPRFRSADSAVALRHDLIGQVVDLHATVRGGFQHGGGGVEELGELAHDGSFVRVLIIALVNPAIQKI